MRRHSTSRIAKGLFLGVRQCLPKLTEVRRGLALEFSQRLIRTRPHAAGLHHERAEKLQKERMTAAPTMHKVGVARSQVLRAQANGRLGASWLEQTDPGRFHAVRNGGSFIVVA